MNRTIQILTGLLAVQLVLAAIMWRPAPEAAPAHALLTVAKESLSEITITGRPAADGKAPDPVKLVKQADGWVIASSANYPTDSKKVDDMLDKLEAIKVSEPIATREASFDSLKVGDTDWGRKVEVTGGGATTSFIVGASHGSTVNVRMAGANEVYEAHGLSEYAIGDSARSYWKAEVVDVDDTSLASVTVTRPGLPPLVFDKQGDDWSVEGLPAGQAPDGDKIGELVKKLVKVRISDVAGAEVKPEYGLESGVHVGFTATGNTVLPVTGYVVGAADAGRAWMQTDGGAFVVKVTKSTFDPLKTANATDYIAGATPPAAPPPGPTPGHPPIR